jgi:uncharacterized protein (TIGR02996 family)
MSDAEMRAAFLADVINKPDDDTPRLVFADYLDDYGDEDDRARAEFIKLQRDLARAGVTGTPEAPSEPVCPETLKLLKREAELLRLHRHAWKSQVTPRYGSRACFRRGFLEQLDLTTAGYLASGAAAHASTPLRSVRLYDSEGTARRLDHGARLAKEAFLARLEALDLLPMSPAQSLELAASPHLHRLQSLRLALSQLDPEHVREACAAPWANRLTVLQFDNRGPDAPPGPFGGMVATSPRLARLEQLALFRTGETAESLAALAGAPHLGSLRHLSLAWHELAPVAAVLAHARGLPSLVHLGLYGCGLDDAGVALLAASSFLARLRRLNLTENDVSDIGAIALAGSPHVSNLIALNLTSRRPLTDRGVRALLESPHLSGLRYLWLYKGRLRPATRFEFARRFGVSQSPHAVA